MTELKKKQTCPVVKVALATLTYMGKNLLRKKNQKLSNCFGQCRLLEKVTPFNCLKKEQKVLRANSIKRLTNFPNSVQCSNISSNQF